MPPRTRRGATEPLVRPAARLATLNDWPPSCWNPECTFRGEPGPESSPYIGGCDGDESKHLRRPVGAGVL